jgi:hypothetical protein
MRQLESALEPMLFFVYLHRLPNFEEDITGA